MTEFYLEEDEDVAVLTKDGRFGGIWARSYQEIISHADEIQGAMVQVTKNSDYTVGNWVWVFKEGYCALEGRKI